MKSRGVLVCIALGCLTAALNAQTLTGDLRTATPYGVFVIDSTKRAFQSIPADTVLPQQQRTVDASTSTVAVSTIFGWRISSSGVLSCDVSEQGVACSTSGPIHGGTTPSTSASSITPGAHALLLRVRGSAGLRGRLRVWGSGLAEGGAKVTMGLDVGNDNTVDFQVTMSAGRDVFDTRQWDTRLAANGVLVVRIVTESAVQGSVDNARFKTAIGVMFEPGAFCDIASYGTSCGPRLAGFEEHAAGMRELRLQLNDAAANALGLLIVGTQRLNLQIPGTRCFLNTEPLLSLPFSTDDYGTASRKLAAPLSLTFAINFQDAVITAGPTLQTSNGVGFACR